MNEQTIPISGALSGSNTPDSAEQPCLIASHALPLPASFSFETYGVRFDASIRKSDDSGAVLFVQCNLGYVPYSAESKQLRRYLHAVVDAGTGLPMAEITLDRSQSIMLRGTMLFPDLPSPAVTAAGTAAIALSVKPVIDIVETCRIGKSGNSLARRRNAFS